MEPVTHTLGRGAAAGLLGTVAMTAFQRFVEMPITKREASFAPAALAERLLPWQPGSRAGRVRLNYVMHFALGTGWGVTRGVMARRGLSGQRAVGATFAAMYPTDVVSATALGVYAPGGWSLRETAIDVVDKLVQAEATGIAYDRLATR